MELKDCRISIYPTKENVVIEIFDWNSNTGAPFVKAVLTPGEFTQAIGRCMSKCTIVVGDLSIVGKKMIYKTFEFKLPDEAIKLLSNEKEKIAKETIRVKCPKGWTPDMYFKSQDSFFIKRENDVKEQWAKTIIRKWV